MRGDPGLTRASVVIGRDDEVDLLRRALHQARAGSTTCVLLLGESGIGKTRLLDETAVLWHSEFGRMPISQRGVGRDHNPGTQTVLMFGAGIKGGQAIGASDEFGYKAMEQPISYHDLHATMLHLMGLDHTKLTYRFNGRDMRLTDVYGTLIPQIVNT